MMTPYTVSGRRASPQCMRRGRERVMRLRPVVRNYQTMVRHMSLSGMGTAVDAMSRKTSRNVSRIWARADSNPRHRRGAEPRDGVPGLPKSWLRGPGPRMTMGGMRRDDPVHRERPDAAPQYARRRREMLMRLRPAIRTFETMVRHFQPNGGGRRYGA